MINWIDKIVEKVNLQTAVNNLQKEQPFLRDRQWMLENLDQKLALIETEIRDETYLPTSMNYAFSYAEKMVVKANLSCKDWIVHKAIVQQVKPFLLAKFEGLHCFYESKDTDQLHSLCKEWKQSNKGVAKTDVRQFFASIHHDILKDLVSENFKEEPIVLLLHHFIDAFDIAAQQLSVSDGFYTYKAGIGLPIGIELAYLFAHLYLRKVDVEMQKHSIYARYIDDFILFGESELALHKKLEQLQDLLDPLHLTLHRDKTFIQLTSESFVFLRQEI